MSLLKRKYSDTADQKTSKESYTVYRGEIGFPADGIEKHEMERKVNQFQRRSNSVRKWKKITIQKQKREILSKNDEFFEAFFKKSLSKKAFEERYALFSTNSFEKEFS